MRQCNDGKRGMRTGGNEQVGVKEAHYKRRNIKTVMISHDWLMNWDRHGRHCVNFITLNFGRNQADSITLFLQVQFN